MEGCSTTYTAALEDSSLLSPDMGQLESQCMCASMQQSAMPQLEVTLLIVPLPMQVALPSLASTLGRNARPSASLAVELACVLLNTDANLDIFLMCKLERLRSVNVGIRTVLPRST